MAIKPILFNTEMVKAILEGRKTQTRRVCKEFGGGSPVKISDHLPFSPGDILWVRETWCKDAGRYMYRANYADDEKFYRDGKEVQLRWSPSIHMPKEAARIFLRVMKIGVQRLQDILVWSGEVKKEGIPYDDEGDIEASGLRFKELWDSTIKPADRDKYGWDANPWVWVIEFERCERPEGWH